MNQNQRGSATRTNSVSAWLNHDTKGPRAGAGFLKGWKKDGSINVFLHMAQPPTFLWQHNLPTIVPVEDPKSKQVTRHVWGRPSNCAEDESVLKNRKRADGRRVAPYQDCGVCRFVEWVRRGVDDGRLDPLKVLFNYQADDPKESTVLHAGGLYNLFGQDDLDVDLLEAMRRAGVSKKTAWKESILSKQNMLFLVVDAAHPEEGLQKTTETGLLGDKVRDCVGKAIKEFGDDGNPFNTYEGDDNTKALVAKGNPYCIQFEYLADEVEFGKKYDATRMSKVACTPAIRRLIDSPPPDIEDDLKPLNAKSMRATLEKHCLLQGVPWDGLFCLDADTTSEAAYRKTETAAVDELFGFDRWEARGRGAGEEGEDAPRGASASVPNDVEPEPEEAEPEQVECDALVKTKVRKGKKVVEEERRCGNVMLVTDAKCSKCGFEYDVPEAEEHTPATPATPAAQPESPKPAASARDATPQTAAKPRGGAKAFVPETDEERSAKQLADFDAIPF